MSRLSELLSPLFLVAPSGWPAGLSWPAPLAPLGPGSAQSTAREIRDSFTAGTGPNPRKAVPKAAQAGILLWWGHLDPSHEISQDLGDQAGSYWHGLMHRREPDHANAAYWFRRVGNHPVFADLAAVLVQGAWRSPAIAARAARKAPWDPFWMNDRCEEARNGGSAELIEELQALQWAEYWLLLRASLT